MEEKGCVSPSTNKNGAKAILKSKKIREMVAAYRLAMKMIGKNIGEFFYSYTGGGCKAQEERERRKRESWEEIVGQPKEFVESVDAGISAKKSDDSRVKE